MRKIIPRKVQVNGNLRWRIIVPKDLRRDQHSKFFQTKGEAMQEALRLQEGRVGVSRDFHGLSREDQARVMRSLARVQNNAACLEQAVDMFLAKNRFMVQSVPLGKAVGEMLREKEFANCRTSYVRALKYSLQNNFLRGREDRECSTVTASEIAAWSASGGYSLDHRRRLLIDARTLFSFCVRQGYCADNPALKVPLPKIEARRPGILTVDQCASLLGACFTTNVCKRTSNLEILPAIALMLFGGVRESEVRRVRWQDVRADYIDLSAVVTKTRDRRLVRKNETLTAWLRVGGQLPPVNFARRIDRVANLAGIPWPKNCLRHSFCSYSIPVHGMIQTAEDAGNSEAMLRQHYRELVTREAADAFWELRPPGYWKSRAF